MANNEESTTNRFSTSNLKVPPLKIVLSSHQNNTVVNISSSLDTDNQVKSSSNDKDDNSNDQLEQDDGNSSRRNGSEVNNDAGEKHHQPKKSSKSSSERMSSESFHYNSSRATAAFSSSSSSSSSSDRSASTTPSSESESLASNSTIISDQQQQQQQQQQHQQLQQQQQVKTKSDTKEDSSSASGKQERVSRHGVKVSSSERSNSSSANSTNKKSNDNTEQTSETASTPSSKEQHLNANQRITRSSQRAAQQSKTENPGESNGDETIAPSENQEKTAHESARKVKRRKGEVQESEQDSAQTTAQLTLTMANIYPADYRLPSQNSFELYRDIRKRPHKKLMKLSHIQPKVPHGFKDYLLNGGPYLLDGNKLGVGLNGAKYETMNSVGDRPKVNADPSERVPLRMKLSNRYQKFYSQQSSHQRHTLYAIPKPAKTPKGLQVGSPLYELFQDQEKARQKMRMQHLKERERSILAAEQEILRTHNRAAIADVKQKLHLSACTYFYYQERYHYSDEKSEFNGKSCSKEVPHSQDNSFLCIEGGEAPVKALDSNSSSSKDSKSSPKEEVKERAGESKSPKEEKNPRDTEDCSVSDNTSKEVDQQIKKESDTSDSSSPITKMDATETPPVAAASAITGGDDDEAEVKGDHKEQQQLNPANQSKSDSNDNSDIVMTSTTTNTKPTEASNDDSCPATKDGQSDKNDDQKKNSDVDSDNSISEPSNEKEDPTMCMSDEDLKSFNKELFLNQLQEIDDKWDKIKKDMLVRHRNEADSLHAVQSLEWEWKAKEIGACDVRVSLKIEPEFVPRVEVLALDY